MKNRSQFEHDIINHSNMPFIAGPRGSWIDDHGTTILLSKMSMTYLNSCFI